MFVLLQIFFFSDLFRIQAELTVIVEKMVFYDSFIA